MNLPNLEIMCFYFQVSTWYNELVHIILLTGKTSLPKPIPLVHSFICHSLYFLHHSISLLLWPQSHQLFLAKFCCFYQFSFYPPILAEGTEFTKFANLSCVLSLEIYLSFYPKNCLGRESFLRHLQSSGLL